MLLPNRNVADGLSEQSTKYLYISLVHVIHATPNKINHQYLSSSEFISERRNKLTAKFNLVSHRLSNGHLRNFCCIFFRIYLIYFK